MNKQVNYKSLLLLAVIILFGSSNNFAQTKLSILYKHGTIKGSLQDYLKPNSTARWNGKFSIDEFTINDTITYYETFETLEEKDEFTVKGLRKNRRNKVLGKNFVPRSNYCNYAKGINIESFTR